MSNQIQSAPVCSGEEVRLSPELTNPILCNFSIYGCKFATAHLNQAPAFSGKLVDVGQCLRGHRIP